MTSASETPSKKEETTTISKMTEDKTNGLSDSSYKHIPTFDGKKANFLIWKTKFMARAKKRGYRDLLNGTTTLRSAKDMEAEGVTSKMESEQQVAESMNEVAFDEMATALETKTAQGKIAFNSLRRTMTKEFPDGNAYTAWVNLNKKFDPVSAPTLARLQEQFYSAKLKKGSDPDNFITLLEDIRVKLEDMESEMTDRQFIVQVLNSLNSDYERQIEMFEDKLDDEDADVSIEDVREKLNIRYERISRQKGDDRSNDIALMAMSTGGGGGKFRGQCYNCGKYGHKGADCRNPKKNANNDQSKNKFTGKCNYCKKVGHKEIECRKKKREQSEQANIATENEANNENCDVVLLGIEADELWCEECSSEGTVEIDAETQASDFTGNCYYCGEYGHKLIDCPHHDSIEDALACDEIVAAAKSTKTATDNKVNEYSRIKKLRASMAHHNCFYCKQKGHIMSVCPEWSFRCRAMGQRIDLSADEYALMADVMDDRSTSTDSTPSEYNNTPYTNMVNEGNTPFGECIVCGNTGPMYQSCYDCEDDTCHFYPALAKESIHALKLYQQEKDLEHDEYTELIDTSEMEHGPLTREDDMTIRNMETKLFQAMHQDHLIQGSTATQADWKSVMRRGRTLFDGTHHLVNMALTENQEDLYLLAVEAVHNAVTSATVVQRLTIATTIARDMAAMNIFTVQDFRERSAVIDEMLLHHGLEQLSPAIHQWMVLLAARRYRANIDAAIKLRRQRLETLVEGSELDQAFVTTDDDGNSKWTPVRDRTQQKYHRSAGITIPSASAAIRNNTQPGATDRYTPHTWLADSGASCHLTHTDEGMYNVRHINSSIKVGSGKLLIATKIGSMTFRTDQKDGTSATITLHDVKYVPGLWVSLMSLGKAMANHFSLGNDGLIITLTKQRTSIRFDRIMTTNTGHVSGVELIPCTNRRSDVALVSATSPAQLSVDINVAHRVLGHANAGYVQNTAGSLGWKLEGTLRPCASCAFGKSRRASIPRSADSHATRKGDLIGFDITYIKHPSQGRAQYWLLVMDHATSHCTSYFMKAKSHTAVYLSRYLDAMAKATGRTTFTLRCDNAGENVWAEKAFRKSCYDVTFQYTAPNTPQQNGKVERKFATLYGRVRSMLNDAQVTQNLRHKLWAEAANTATLLDNLLVGADGQSPYQRFHGSIPRFTKFLRVFGEVGMINYTGKAIKAKLENRARHGILVGYSLQHAGGVYRMYDCETNRVILSRDIKWMQQSYGQFHGVSAGDMSVTILDDNGAPALGTVGASPIHTTVPTIGVDFADAFESATLDPDAPIPPKPTFVDPRTLSDDDDSDDDHSDAASNDASNDDNDNDDNDDNDDDTSADDDGDGATTLADAAVGRDDADDTQVPTSASAPPARVKPSYAQMRAAIKAAHRYNTRVSPQITAAPAESSGSMPTATKAVTNELKRLHTSYNPLIDVNLPTQTDDSSKDVVNSVIDFLTEQPGGTSNTHLMEVAATVLDPMDIPKSFNDAWDHPDPPTRDKWRAAINKEYNDMDQRGVWTKVKRKTMPKDRRCVKNKWVFNIKRNGVHRARLVACGYSQIPGVDYTDYYAPVVNDATYRILIICEIIWGLYSIIADFATAFLYGELEEEIFMNCPPGMDHEKDDILLLNKTIYGLVQSARQWYKKLVEILEKLGFQQSLADPCLLVKRTENSIVIITLYVDDCYCIGTKDAIKQTIRDIKTAGFTIKIEENLSDYLSCNIAFNHNKTKAWLGQPHLLKHLEEKFGPSVQSLQRYRTPGTPGSGIIRPTKENQLSKLNADEQTLYRSGVGMLLFLVKHSRPDIANAVRELSKVMDGATQASMKELLRVIKFVLDTREYGLKIEPIDCGKECEWELTMYSDSEYGGDKDNRISIGGYILFLMNVPILWRSRAQRSVTLSSAEAEYIALSEAAKEVKFIVQVLDSLGIKVKQPVTIRVDNVGAIFMTRNASTSSRTRHVDIRYHFVRKMVVDGEIEIIFVRSEDNLSDGFTKNVKGDIYDQHKDAYLMKKKVVMNE